MELPLTLELDHRGMHLATIECVAIIEPASPDVSEIYMYGSTGHFLTGGPTYHRILLSETESDPLLAGIARQAWEVARLPGFQAEVRDAWLENTADDRALRRARWAA